MKLMERMKQKRQGNKGFSLVELIIVIAIMAILIGIIGTQVIPYLNRAREERDMQVINSFSTAAVTYYSLHTDEYVSVESKTGNDAVVVFDLYAPSFSEGTGTKPMKGSTEVKPADWKDGFDTLTGYKTLQGVKDAMVSKVGRNDISKIIIIYNFGTTDYDDYDDILTPAGAVTATAVDASGEILLGPATSYIKGDYTN